MRFLSVLAVAPLALASAITKRDAQGVYNAVTNIDITVRALTAQVAAYNGGIPQSKPVFDAAIDIHKVNRDGFAVAVASEPFTSAESARIVQHVSDTVGVSIPAGLQLLESKKALFDAAELSYLVDSTINLLKYDHETFSAAVGTKLSPDQVVPGAAAAGEIDAALQVGSLYYATPLTV